MRIVKFEGALGNQMFSYAFYKALKNHNNSCVVADLRKYKFPPFIINGYELNRIFDVKYDYVIFSFTWYKIVNFLTGKKKYVKEEGTGIFDPKFLDYGNSVYYDGFFQSEKYFAHIADEVRKAFQFKPVESEANKTLVETIQNSNSVFVHVRRSDYLKFANTQGICTPEYYTKAADYIRSKVDNPVFFVFSDDINWCKENLQLGNCHYVDHNTGLDSYIDMQLMSYCKHGIIANSTFSWWGAWLKEYAGKIVIAPSRWFQDDLEPDIIPESWIRI